MGSSWPCSAPVCSDDPQCQLGCWEVLPPSPLTDREIKAQGAAVPTWGGPNLRLGPVRLCRPSWGRGGSSLHSQGAACVPCWLGARVEGGHERSPSDLQRGCVTEAWPCALEPVFSLPCTEAGI